MAKKDLFVSRLKAKFGPDEPIFTFEIAKTFPNISLVRVHQLLNEAEAAGDIRRFQQGIHYIPSEKSSKLDVNRIIVKKYVTDGKEIFGISYGFLGYLPSLFRDPHYREEQVYDGQGKTGMPWLIFADNYQLPLGGASVPYGRTEDVLYRNIQASPSFPPIR